MSRLLFALLFLWAQVCVADEAVYFSPKGGCQQAVVDLINSTNAKLDVAVYSINNAAIVKALEDAKARKVAIRILTDHEQAAVNAATTKKLLQEGFDLRVHSVGRIMHNKFAVSDGQVFTGSFNWTEPAENANEENCVVFSNDGEILAAYNMRFTNHLWSVNTQAKSDAHLQSIKPR